MNTREVKSLRAARRAFLMDVLRTFPSSIDFSVVLITHCVADRPAFVDVLHRRYPIAAVLAIPYSANASVIEELRTTVDVHQPSLRDLENPGFVESVVTGAISTSDRPVAVIEIGGYCAPSLHNLKERHGEAFLGSVEDTEGGHRRYEALPSVPCPVVSVARSPLKMIEDRLIGPSIIFSIERVLRDLGQPLVGITLGVLGYGRIGSSVARAALNRVSRVLAFDISARARALAIADGVNSPTRDQLLRQADVIVGATGSLSLAESDFVLLKPGVFLASASSRQIEFPIAALERASVNHVDGPEVREYQLGDRKSVYVVNSGVPVNFLHGAVVGSAINLVQGEMLVAASSLARHRDRQELLTISPEEQDRLVQLWLDHFVDQTTGGMLPLADLAR